MTNFHSLIPGGFFSDGTSGPVSIRANNPGAINGAFWERSYPGFVGNIKYDGRNDTTVFEAPEYGVAAWWELMRRYREGDYHATTLRSIITTYGGGQANYPTEYVDAVARWTGFLPDREIKIDGSDDDGLLKFAKAMFRFEAGRETPLSDAQILYGFAIGRNGGKLPENSQSPRPPPVLPQIGLNDSAIASRILLTMDSKGFPFDKGEGELNIVYIEGMNPDGTPNNNAIDKWNDLRIVVGLVDGVPTLLFKCEATTAPGIYYDRDHVIGGPQGAAIITLGQQKCWQVGWHSPGGGQEALVQTGGAVSVYRDFDRSFRRQEGHITTGWYGINQHGTREGVDGSPTSIGPWSAGCLVARRFANHRAFMALVKSDPRYKANRQYVFSTTILASGDVLAKPVVVTTDTLAPPVTPVGRTVGPRTGVLAACATAIFAAISWLNANPVRAILIGALAAVVGIVVIEAIKRRSAKGT